jgi:hypothetical protein
MSGNELGGVVPTVFGWVSLGTKVLGAGAIVAGIVEVVITRGTIR